MSRRTDWQVEAARLHLENAARAFHKPPLGESPAVSQERLHRAAIELSKACDRRDAVLQAQIAKARR